jgi:hypothetical protein
MRNSGAVWKGCFFLWLWNCYTGMVLSKIAGWIYTIFFSIVTVVVFITFPMVFFLNSYGWYQPMILLGLLGVLVVSVVGYNIVVGMRQNKKWSWAGGIGMGLSILFGDFYLMQSSFDAISILVLLWSAFAIFGLVKERKSYDI